MSNEFVSKDGKPYVLEEIISANEISTNIQRVGEEIARDYRGELPILAIVVKGGVRFGGRLMDELDKHDQPYQYDILALTSYGDDTESSKEPRLMLDMSLEIANRHVIIVEDIVDTGYSIDALLRLLSTRNPKSLKVASLFSKSEARQVNVQIDYLGMEIPNDFVVQMGLDYQQQHRDGSGLAKVKFI